MTTEKLKSCIQILGRYTRSIDIERDYGDLGALEGYVLTPQGVSVLDTLLKGFSRDSRQRAWILNGHYGVGKSALALLFLSMINPAGGKFTARVKKIYTEHPMLGEKLKSRLAYDTILLSGVKNQFSVQLISSVKEKISQMSAGAGRPPSVLKAVNSFLEKKQYDNLDDFAAIEIFDQFLEYWKKHAGTKKRLLLVIDEMGAAIENMAAYQDKKAPAIFQYLAEKSAGSGPMSILGITHRSIYEYGVEWDKETLKEWSKVADRFEHIALQGSVEHVAYLLDQSIVLKSSAAFKSKLKSAARQMRKKYFSDDSSGNSINFEKIFPVHPAAAVLLRTIAQRFQQSDRSFFSFLMSSEPGGLQEFIAHAPAAPTSWYRVEHLSSFLLGGGMRISDIDRRRRVVTLEDIINNPLPDPLQNSILKTIAVMDILQPVMEMPLTAEAVAWAVSDDGKCPQVFSAIEELIKKGCLHRRHHDGRISVWVRGGINLALEFEKISERQDILPLDSITPILQDWQHLQAHRHYLETGHMRYAQFCLTQYGDKMGTPDTGCGPVIQIILVDSRNPRQMVIKKMRQHSASAGSNLLVHACFLSNHDRLLLQNWGTWKWLVNHSEQIKSDEIAYAEAQVQLKEHENRVRKLLGLDGAFKRSASFNKAWFRTGRLMKIDNMRELQHRLSDMMGEIYHSAPVIKNELINRPKVSSAITFARNKLIECILDNPEQENLGMCEGFPPEKLIYDSLLKKSGIHRKSDLTGILGLSVPAETSNEGFAKVWQALDQALYEGNCQMSAKKLSELLTLPPFGLNFQISSLLVALYIITTWDRISVMEKGTLQLSIGKEIFARYFKNSANFVVKLHVHTDESENIFKSYSAIDAWGDIKPDSHPVVAIAREIYGWYNNLPEYAKKTPRISEKAKHLRAALERAREPFDLVMRVIPQIVMDKKKNGHAKTFAAALNLVVNELDSVFPKLMDNVMRLCPLVFGKQMLSLGDFQSFLIQDYQDTVSIMDGKEKVFFERCARPIHDEREWFASLASAVVGLHPEKWHEQHEDAFTLQIRSLASALQRKKAFATTGNLASDVVRVYLVHPDGREAAFILDMPPHAHTNNDLTADILDAVKSKGIRNFDHALVHVLCEREQGGIIANE